MNEAELLFTEILSCDRVSLYLDKNRRLGLGQSARVALALQRRFCGEPIQYILGKTEFMGLKFKVNKDVFIPRPDTEVLVETAVKIAQGCRLEARGIGILDLCTGSGCIAVSLAKLLTNVKMAATDISQEAINIARENARFHHVEDRIKFIKSDLFAAFSLKPIAFSLIVSNPPYIAAKDIEGLGPEIRHEPVIALDGGEDGLDFYRRLIIEAPDYLKVGGFLIMEIGFGQSSSIQDILNNSKKFEIIEAVKDYSDIERVVVARIA